MEEKTGLSPNKGREHVLDRACACLSRLVAPTLPRSHSPYSTNPLVLPHYPPNSVLASHSLSFFPHNFLPRGISSSSPLHGAIPFVVVSLISNYPIVVVLSFG